jgi:hypothetical protein
MRGDAKVAVSNRILAALTRVTAVVTADSFVTELRPRPIVHPEWLSLENAAACRRCPEQFSDFVKGWIGRQSGLFSRNDRRFKRSDLDAWCGEGGPSTYSSKGDPGAVRR